MVFYRRSFFYSFLQAGRTEPGDTWSNVEWIAWGLTTGLVDIAGSRKPRIIRMKTTGNFENWSLFIDALGTTGIICRDGYA